VLREQVYSDSAQAGRPVRNRPERGGDLAQIKGFGDETGAGNIDPHRHDFFQRQSGNEVSAKAGVLFQRKTPYSE